MEDLEFIRYCEAHCETERAGFVPSNLERIYRLAGDDEKANEWAKKPLNIFSVFEDVMKPLCAQARERLELADQ